MNVSHTPNFGQSKAALEVLFPKVLEARESRVNELATRIFEDEDLCGVICSNIRIEAKTSKSRPDNDRHGVKLIGLNHLAIVSSTFRKVVQKRYELEVQKVLDFSEQENQPELNSQFKFLNVYYSDLYRKWIGLPVNLFRSARCYSLDEMREMVERRNLFSFYNAILMEYKDSLDLQSVPKMRMTHVEYRFDSNPDELESWLRTNKEKIEAMESLDLSHVGLIRIPKEISFFKNLKFINLFCNHIRSLPSELLTLKNLEKIHVEISGFSETFRESATYKTLSKTIVNEEP